jgi:1-acyl-sn-glycerol-3-phosphate acyltransferase
VVELGGTPRLFLGRLVMQGSPEIAALRPPRSPRLQTAGSLARWIASGFLFSVLALVVLVAGRRVSARRMFPFSQWVFARMLRISGARLEAEGRERLDPARGYVYIFNHQSFLDHFALASQVPGFLVGVEKIESRSIPVYGFVTRWWGNVAIDRSNPEEAIQSIAETQRVLREGVSICVAPEGTRSRDGRVGPFKKGGFHMAVEMGAPIAPVSIIGMAAVNPDRRFQLRAGPVRLVFHEPIETRPGDDVVTLAAEVRERICSVGLLRRESSAAPA